MVSADEARARFETASRSRRRSRPRPCRSRKRSTRVLAHDVVAAVDAPPFDRSNVDGFALRAADTVGAGDAQPENLPLNAEVIACGDAPTLEVAPGTATAIATGGVIPRGADAVVMIEQTELIEAGRAAHRAAPRRRARAIHLLCRLRHRARRDAAAARHAHRLARDRHAGGLRARRKSTWCGGRRSRCCRPATNWSRPARRSKPAGVYDSNGAIIAAAVTEAGGEPLAMRRFSRRRGGAGKGRARRRWRKRHGRAVGRHLEGRRRSVARASCRGSARPAFWCTASRSSPASRSASASSATSRSWCCPAFPTSAIFTFHAFVAPVIRARAGLPPEAARNADRARAGAHCLRTRPQGIRAGVADRERRTARSRSRPAKAPAR